MIKYYMMSLVVETKPHRPPATLVAPDSEVTFRVGSLEDSLDLDSAVDHILNQRPVAFQFRHVVGIAINGDDPKMVSRALEIKQEAPDPKRYLSSMGQTEQILEHADISRIHPAIRPLFRDVEGFRTLSTICHVRVPIKAESVTKFPPPMISVIDDTPYVHHLDSFGHPVHNLVDHLTGAGIEFIAVTTLNTSKIQAEITSPEAAKEFCTQPGRKGKISLLLADPTRTREEIKGSFPIIDLTERRGDDKLRAIRHGHIPMRIVEKIIGMEIDTSEAKSAAYPQADFSPVLEVEGLSQRQVRERALAFIGMSSDLG